MSGSLVQSESSHGVLSITLNRPEKRNALSRALLRELTDAVRAAETAAGIRLVVLAANGPVFCAGMDLAEMQETAKSPDSLSLWEHDTNVYHDIVRGLFQLPMPTLAVVQGPVLAGGVGLVAACDLVLAAEKATVALPEPKRGITAAVVLPLLRLRTGASAASWLLLSGETCDSSWAMRSGLFHAVASEQELPARQASLIESILSGGAAALTVTKKFLRECSANEIDTQLQSGKTCSAAARATDEAREGLAAFLEKRKPRWCD